MFETTPAPSPSKESSSSILTMISRVPFVVGCRVLSTAFFAMTTMYWVLTASPFAYHQFIRPGLFPWLVWGARLYPFLLLGILSLTVLTLVSELATRRRFAVLPFVVVMYTAALVLLVFPGFTTDGDPVKSLTIAAVALVPPLWLAVIDHLASLQTVFSVRITAQRSEPRIFATAAAAGLYIWVLYAAISLLQATPTAVDTSWLFTVGVSALAHGTAFAAIAWLFVAISSIARTTRNRRVFEYMGAVAFFAVWLFVVCERSLLPALALRGVAASLVAAGLSLTIAACWSGVALRLAATDGDDASAFELFCRPIARARPPLAVAVQLLVVAIVAFGLIRVTAPIDWGFLLQKTGVFAVWMVTWATIYAAMPSRRGPSRGIAIATTLLIVFGYGATHLSERQVLAAAAAPQVTAAIDRYATYDVSFKVLRDTFRGRSSSPDFYRLLSAHANIDAAVSIAPKQIDFGPPLVSRAARRPDIFLFVIDSLRRDYLSPYNRAVTFTPNIAAFAADSLVFRNAFSRYGGTGLAVPSIFSGSLLPHRQYVLPFAPMNALGRLLEREGYRFAMSTDSITAHLRVAPADAVTLRAGHGPTSGDMCDTLADLQHLLAMQTDRPLFAYTLPQNLHVAYVASQPRPSTDYPGFHAATAAQLSRLDDCFGRFVRFLKANDRFDESLIVVTSDHGDSLGEDGRWGHSDAAFPEIFQIPLIIHLPADMRGWIADPASVSFSTDIAPTIYTLLGGNADPRSRLFGAPLVSHDGDMHGRRQEEYLLASSYGPVFGLLTTNGRRLYVVDAINARDYAFDLTGGDSRRRVNITDAERELNQQRLAQQLHELSTLFGYDVGE